MSIAICNAKAKFIEYKERQKDKIIYYVYIDRSTFVIFEFKAKLQGSKPIAVDSLEFENFSKRFAPSLWNIWRSPAVCDCNDVNVWIETFKPKT